MRCLTVSLSVLVMLLSQDLLASAKTDSIVAFLDGAHGKLVWTRWAWCTDDYKPKPQAAGMAEGWSLELIDTREGKQRSIVTGLKDPHNIRISRSGKWVIFIDGTETATYIIDLTAATPTKKVLMSKADCTFWAVGAWWIDPANGDEWAYCLDNATYPPSNIGGGDGITKVKVRSDGTVDLSTATKLPITGLRNGDGGAPIDASISVSADGKKLGGAFPWPDTKILDIATGRLDYRHHEGFGCQANIAPDSSYRFFHCESDHQGIYMFDANLSTTNWFVDLHQNLIGDIRTGSGDFLRPRWTNSMPYFVYGHPMSGYLNNAFNTMDRVEEFYASDGSSLWSKDANWVKTQMNLDRVNKVYLAKFSPDFKSQEKVIIIGADLRYFQCYIDAWVCNGTTFGNQCGTSVSSGSRGDRVRGLSVVQDGAFLNIEANGKATVRITDVRGRAVRMWSRTGDRGLDTRALTTGTYVLSVTAGERSTSIRLPVVEGSGQP